MASSGKPFVIAKWPALLLCVLLVPAAARAANNCPWLTEATASGLLGAQSVGTFTPSTPEGTGVCTFSEADSRTPRTLQISVESASESHARVLSLAASCTASSSPLTAIGNEALVCSADDRKERRVERVIGRVRDQVFTITLSGRVHDDPAFDEDALKTRIYTAAEQVAGNLF